MKDIKSNAKSRLSSGAKGKGKLVRSSSNDGGKAGKSFEVSIRAPNGSVLVTEHKDFSTGKGGVSTGKGGGAGGVGGVLLEHGAG